LIVGVLLAAGLASGVTYWTSQRKIKQAPSSASGAPVADSAKLEPRPTTYSIDVETDPPAAQLELPLLLSDCRWPGSISPPDDVDERCPSRRRWW
jgi:hypothetical protein